MSTTGAARKLALVAVLAWTASAPVSAQRVRFTRFGLEDGLSQYSGYAIVQDVDGFLWVGTQNGLNRFDGRVFRSSWMDGTERSPVSYALVHTLFSDAEGRLWAGLDDRGLHLFDRGREEFHAVPVLGPDGAARPPPARFNAFAEVGARVLVATDEGIASVVADSVAADSDGVALRIEGWSADGCGRAVTGMWAATDTLWVGTADGCVALRRMAEKGWSRVVARVGVPVTVITSGPKGSVNVGTDGRGVLAFDRDGTPRFGPDRGGVVPPTNAVEALLTTPEDDAWIGTRGGLGWIQPRASDTTWFTLGSEEAGALPHARILSLYEDRSGVLWIGTWHGLARLSPFYKGIRFIPVLAAPSDEAVGGVVSIISDGPRRLLAGSVGGVVASVSRFGTDEDGGVDEGPDIADIRSMTRGRNGDLWVATSQSGIYRRTRAGWREYRGGRVGRGSAPGDRVSALLVDRAGTVWAGARERGLWAYDPAADAFHPASVSDPAYGLASAYVWPIREDGSGSLWFGKNDAAAGGIFRLAPDRRTLDFFRTAVAGDDRPNTGRVLTLLLSGDTLVWFGTQGGGLGRLDPRTGGLRFYTTEDGLPNDNVEGILEDGAGKLWVSTNLGLARFDPVAERFWGFLEGSGIPVTSFFANAAFEADDGLLYFGSDAGITVIDPRRVAPRASSPPVALTRFLVGGVQRVDITNRSARSGVTLEPGQNFFTVDFAALDYTEPLQNQFRYRLDDFEDEWVEAGTERSARYTGVPPGHYTFFVQAASSEGAWNRAGLAIPIFVRPRLLQTSWFRALLAALFAGVLLVAYQYRRNQLARVRGMRLQIAGELHDDIGANLSAIALKSDLVRRVGVDETRAARTLADIQRLTHDTMQKVREMIWVVKEDHDTVAGLLSRMEEAARTLLSGVVELEFVVAPGVPEAPLPMEARQDVYRVFKEALQNVMKHADASLVRIEIGYRSPDLCISIADDGVGFDEDQIQQGTGLRLMKIRDRWHGAHVVVSSEPGAGTRVDITLAIQSRGHQPLML